MGIRRLLWPIVLIYLSLLSNFSAWSYTDEYKSRVLHVCSSSYWQSNASRALYLVIPSKELDDIIAHCIDINYLGTKGFCECLEDALRWWWNSLTEADHQMFTERIEGLPEHPSFEALGGEPYAAQLDRELVFEYPQSMKMNVQELTYPSCRADIDYVMTPPYKTRMCRRSLGHRIENDEKSCDNCSTEVWVDEVLGGVLRCASTSDMALKYGRKNSSDAEHSGVCMADSKPDKVTKKREIYILPLPKPKQLAAGFRRTNSPVPKNCAPPPSFWARLFNTDDVGKFVPCPANLSEEKAIARFQQLVELQVAPSS